MLEAHWLGHQVELARSTGGVLAFADPWEAVLRGQISPWPPPELVQKLYRSRQVRAYTGSDNVAATRSLGYYCDLQSVHSEDAVTWSLFGPLAYAAPDIRVSFARQLLGHLGLAEPVTNVSIWLWRRLPHPDTLVPGGPEIDVGIQTDSVLILGEAKWRSDVGSAQGVDQNKDQIEIRTDFCCKYGTRAYPSVRHFVVLGIGLRPNIIAEGEVRAGPPRVSQTATTWEALGQLDANPYAPEFRAQLAWRIAHSQRT